MSSNDYDYDFANEKKIDENCLKKDSNELNAGKEVTSFKKPLIHSITSMLMNDSIAIDSENGDESTKRGAGKYSNENNSNNFNDSIKENMKL